MKKLWSTPKPFPAKAIARSREGRFIWRALLLLFDLYAGGLVAYFLLRVVSGYRLWPVALISQFLHWLLLPTLPLLLLMLVLRLWRRVALSAVSVLAFIILFGGLFIPQLGTEPACASGDNSCHTLTVMTFNIGAGLADSESLIRMLRESDVDIIGLQEVSAEEATLFDRELQDVYPYRVLYGLGGSGRGLLSRYPIVDQKLIDVNWEHLPPYLQATLDVDGTPLTVVVFHAHPPRIGRYVSRFGYHMWRGGVNLTAKLSANSSLLILADLNTTDQSPDYRALQEAGLIDVFHAAGWGFGLTFPTRFEGWHALPGLPLVRIDYIWTTKDFLASCAWVGLDAGSDHLPVLARLVWRPQ